MFKEAYQKAYDEITPDNAYILKIEEKLSEKQKRKKGYYIIKAVKPVVTAFSTVAVLGFLMLPVMAKEIPAIYRIIEKYAPSLAEFALPEKYSSSSQGIKMQVEAIQVEEKTAEIIVSFTDEEGYDFIHGKVDMYDSYGLYSYSGVSNIGGCSFLEYSEEEDKAYFKVSVATSDTFDKEKLTFRVRQLLTENSKERKEIDITNADRNPKTKPETLNGYGGSEEKKMIVAEYFGKSDDGSYRAATQILDTERTKEMINNLTITGIAYTDGILRIQTCRGEFAEADRHLQPFLIDENGVERHNDISIGWQEDIDGVRVLFAEHWFFVEEEELDKVKIEAIFHVTGGNIDGKWEVTFKVDSF